MTSIVFEKSTIQAFPHIYAKGIKLDLCIKRSKKGNRLNQLLSTRVHSFHGIGHLVLKKIFTLYGNGGHL